MRLALAVLLLGFASAATAQIAPRDSVVVVLVPVEAAARPDVPRRLHGLATAGTLYLSYGGSFLVAALTGAAVSDVTGSDEAGVVVGFAAYPLAVAGATYGLGRLFRADGTFKGSLRGAAIGAGVGVASGLVIGALLVPALNDRDVENEVDVILAIGDAVALAGLIVLPYALGPPIGAVLGFNGSVRPDVAVLPAHAGGGRVPLVALRVRL